MVTDYSTWSHQQLHDAVMALDPAQINGAAYHWAQASLAWSQISTDVANHTKTLIPAWTGPAANACYQYTAGLLRRNVQFQNVMTQAAPLLRTLAMNVYQARVQMPDPVDQDTLAAAAGSPTHAQLEAQAAAQHIPKFERSAVVSWAATDPSSPIHQAAVTAAQTAVDTAHYQAIGVATTLASQFEQAHTQLQAIQNNWQQAQKHTTGLYDVGKHLGSPNHEAPSRNIDSPSSQSVSQGVATAGAPNSNQTGQSRPEQSFTAVSEAQNPKPSRPVRPPSGTGKAPSPVRPGGPPTGQQYPPPPYVPLPPGPSIGPRPGNPSGTGLKDFTTPPSGVGPLSPSQIYVPQGGGWSPSGNSGGWNSIGTVGGLSPSDGWGASGDGIAGGITGSGAGSRRVAGADGEGEGGYSSRSGSSASEAATREAGAATEGEASMPMGMMGGGTGGGGDNEQRGQRPAYLLNDDDEYWTGSKVKRAAPPGGVIE
jgi:hypothetical protein